MTRRSSISIELMSRDFGDQQWVHLIPAGTFQGRDGRGPYKLVDPKSVIDSSRRQAGKRQIPIDYDHAIDLAAPQGGAAPAAGWIKGLQSRSDGIWGLVSWTPRAAEQLAQREYRYLSPAFIHASDGTVTTLLRASLTNNPNLDQLTALASMENTTMDAIAAICQALGLPETASTEEILARIRDLSAPATPSTHSATGGNYDPSKFVPIGDFQRAMETIHELNTGISLQAATDHVDRQIEAGKLFKWNRDWAIALCQKDRRLFDQFANGVGKVIGTLTIPLLSVQPPSLHHRRPEQQLSDEELQIAKNIGVSAESYLKTKQARTAQE
jgi:phage I-like protein